MWVVVLMVGSLPVSVWRHPRTPPFKDPEVPRPDLSGLAGRVAFAWHATERPGSSPGASRPLKARWARASIVEAS